MFMLVREGNDPGLFVCPSDTASKDPNYKDPGTGAYRWDFSKPDYVSYSVQCIRTDPNNALLFSKALQFFMADKNPDWDAPVKPLMADTAGWTDNPSDDTLKMLMPSTHGVEMFNAVKGDGLTAIQRRGDVGDLVVDSGGSTVVKDNIYSEYGNSPSNCRKATAVLVNDWNDVNDAFLFGPIKTGQ